MTRLLLVASAFGLSLSAASACEYMRSADAAVDGTITASTIQSGTNAMSLPALPTPAIDDPATDLKLDNKG